MKILIKRKGITIFNELSIEEKKEIIIKVESSARIVCGVKLSRKVK